MSFNIEVEGGSSVRLPTAGKYCDRDIIIKALGGGGSSGGGLEVTEGTITPATESQTLRIPWQKETLPLFWVCIRQDCDTHVTPDNPATGAIIGCVVQFASGYSRISGSQTVKYMGTKFTATTDYTGYTSGPTSAEEYGILTADGLMVNTNSGSQKWKPDTTYKYYIVDKVVQ